MGISFRSNTMGSIPTGLIVALLIVTVRSHVPQESSAMDPPQAPGVADIVKLILGYITPRSDPLPISESCKVAGDDYLNSIADNKAVKYNQYMNMLDSSALLPSSGFLGSDQNIFHHPGSFSECLGIKDEHGRPMSQYCLLPAINVLLIPPDKRPQLFNMSRLPSNEHLIPDGQSLEEATRAAGKNWNNDNCPLTGAACQIYFTIENDEYFHGGFGYYVKPWNRSHPYLIGILLGYVLHKMRDQPKL